MKHMIKTMAVAISATILLFSCSKNAKPDSQQEEVSQAVKDQILRLGFSDDNVQRVEEGYLVEGDIVLTPDDLNSTPQSMFLRVGDEEQYRTTNVVTGLPRNITVQVSSRLSARYITATDAAIGRYNAQGLRITFSRVTSGGNINITTAPPGGGYLASAGFPSSNGNPYGTIKVNRAYLDTWDINTVTSIIAHEIGHCVGFRHTDYMNRSYSCGGSAVNEGASSVGAIHIPGTPAGPDPNSWMLSCIGNGVNRPFNSNDRTALGYVY